MRYSPTVKLTFISNITIRLWKGDSYLKNDTYKRTLEKVYDQNQNLFYS